MHADNSPELPAKDPDSAFFSPLFLGSAGENEAVLERLLTSFLRDHVHWRRNFHPEDPPSIHVAEQLRPAFAEAVGATEQALRVLSARLKRSLPLFSPRYVGHMTSDLLLPGLLAELITTLYNPNNVSAEAAPVTLDLEIEVGQQLASMLGFATDEASVPAAYGHLTSGGTLANVEGLWLHRALRFFAPSVARAFAGTELAVELGLPDDAADVDAWQWINRDADSTFALQDRLEHVLAERGDAARWRERLRTERVEHLGIGAWLSRQDLPAPVVIAPRTAHYSWPKAMQLLGLGDAQLWYADLDSQMRVDPMSVSALLDRAFAQRIPVLSVVAVLGTTEFGTIDPLHEMIRLRAHCAARGQSFLIHVDAAWGGYLSTLLRRSDGGWVPRAELRQRFRHFPSEPVYRAFRALPEADTVTVDPHKLGYLPFGTGAFVARDRRMTRLVGQRPPYLFDEANPALRRDRLGELGDYIIEGSKPGAAAAAAWINHRVLPLDSRGFGRLCANTLDASEALYDGIAACAERLAPRCRLLLPVEPDTNLVCLVVNPGDNRSPALMNRLMRSLFGRFANDAKSPVQLREFIGSHTSLLRRNLTPAAAQLVAERCGIDASLFVAEASARNDSGGTADHLFLLRHTLMNPWLTRDLEGGRFIDRYLDYLEASILATLEGFVT
ncbi:MAG: pyridoxal-dependent decarboxylase [Xanthomonadales bacterium]|nr:pyridoxal-dependent decarboxylase [Xanthomonadales bacterium]